MPLTKDQAKQVYAQAFFAKLAEHGIVPQSDEDRQELMHLATHTRKLASVQARRAAVNHSGAVKKANAFFDRHFNGDAALDELIGAHSKAAEGKDKGKDKDKKPPAAAPKMDAGGSC